MSTLFPSLNNPDSKDIKSGTDYIIPVFESVDYKIDQILFKIDHIDTLDEAEIKNIIYRQYHLLFNYDLFIANERKYALALFMNKRFLKILLDIIGTLELSNNEIICINKLTYDYYCLKEKDKEISDLLLQLSSYVNNKMSIRLSAILGIRNSRILAMIANSAFKIEKNVNRVNRFIIKTSVELDTLDILNIYCTLYDRFMYPIIYTMLEVEPSTLNDEEHKRFSMISSVVLTLLNSMTSEDIYKVLSNYAYLLQLNNIGKNVRFSIKDAAIRNNLDRISSIVYRIELETDENPVCL